MNLETFCLGTKFRNVGLGRFAVNNGRDRNRERLEEMRLVLRVYEFKSVGWLVETCI
jgi:hypothetical protein